MPLPAVLTQQPDELIEVHCFDLTPASWEALFAWLPGRIVSACNAAGTLDPSAVNLADFLHNKQVYTIDVTMPSGNILVFALLETDHLSIDIDKAEINTEASFATLLADLAFLAELLGCTRYVVHPEFKPEAVFVVNGVVEDAPS